MGVSGTQAKGVRQRRFVGNVDAYILLAFLAYGVVSQYLLLTVVGGLAFVTILRSLWKPYVPPVLLFFILMHWIQVFCAILYADFKGASIDQLFDSKDTDFLMLMTFLQIVLMALLLNRFVNSGKLDLGKERLQKAAMKINTRNVVIAYFVTLVAMPIILSLTKNSPSLLQIVYSLGIVKHLIVSILFFVILLKPRKNRVLVVSILILDFFLSFASYFSDFKTILIMAIVVYYTVNPSLRRVTAYRILPLVVLLVVFFSFWSFVKGSYREYLNQGAEQQVIAVSDYEALSYLFSRVGDFNAEALNEGLTLFIQRAQYMERYSEVYARVPSEIPHQQGDDISATVEFLLIPRFINESKGVKDASQRTSYYTGKKFSNAAQGTSISMGYFCDLYIDFGLYMMIIPLLVIAGLVGFLYRKILDIKGYNILFSYGVLMGTFLSLGTFESDSVLFLGTLRNHVAFLVLGYFAIFPRLQRFMFKK